MEEPQRDKGIRNAIICQFPNRGPPDLSRLYAFGAGPTTAKIPSFQNPKFLLAEFHCFV
jgi:hypothetical protein